MCTVQSLDFFAYQVDYAIESVNFLGGDIVKKIFAYVGSRQHLKSQTYFFTRKVVDAVQAKMEIEYEIVTPLSFQVEHCSGCQYCFKHAKCVKENKDDMKIIQDKILESDLIIFASPVYVHNVSGDMKILIDRLGYWGHLLKLAGKGSVVLTTNMSNGHDTALNYLEKILTSFGSTVIAKYNAATNFPNQLYDSTWLEAVCEIISISIIDCLNNGVKATPNLEGLFSTLKEMMLLYKKHGVNEGEWKYWEEHDYLDCDSFSSLLSRKNGVAL